MLDNKNVHPLDCARGTCRIYSEALNTQHTNATWDVPYKSNARGGHVPVETEFVLTAAKACRICMRDGAHVISVVIIGPQVEFEHALCHIDWLPKRKYISN